MDDDRDESEDEKLDRKFNDLLQELRSCRPVPSSPRDFLLTLPFQQSFGSLDGFQRDLYLVLVVLAAITTAVVVPRWPSTGGWPGVTSRSASS